MCLAHDLLDGGRAERLGEVDRRLHHRSGGTGGQELGAVFDQKTRHAPAWLSLADAQESASATRPFASNQAAAVAYNRARS